MVTSAQMHFPEETGVTPDQMPALFEEIGPLIETWAMTNAQVIHDAFPDTTWCLHFDYAPIVRSVTFTGEWHKVSTYEDMARWN